MLPHLAALLLSALGASASMLPTTTTRDLVSRAAPVASLCTQYAYLKTNGYEILNNLWGIDTATGGGSQCTYYNGPVGPAVAFSSDWTWRGNDNTVKSYIYANRVFDRRLVSDIKSLPTSVQWSYNTTNVRANVAYDIFTHTDVNHPNSSGDFELMIWLQRYGGIWPITESSTGSPVERVTIAGYTWELFTGWNGAMRVYSFLPPSGTSYNSFSADVKVFFDYLGKKYAFPASKQYMLIYNFGTEAFTGGPAHFDVSRFQAEVQV
ncbi:hypothetical protein PspLS_01538 [Pyricularia sp. CBS 133598]|nr:hypothetical protein PspLS_01538 [Pyricularia sp. CBS 133598]